MEIDFVVADGTSEVKVFFTSTFGWTKGRYWSVSTEFRVAGGLTATISDSIWFLDPRGPLGQSTEYADALHKARKRFGSEPMWFAIEKCMWLIADNVQNIGFQDFV